MTRRKFFDRFGKVVAGTAAGLWLPKYAIAQGVVPNRRRNFQPASSGGLITSGLLLRYAMTEGSGSTTADSSGNSHTGTLHTSPTWGTGPHAGVGSLTFAFTSDYQYISTGSTAGVANNLSNFSVMSWFKTSVGNTQTYAICKNLNSGTDQPGWVLGIGDIHGNNSDGNINGYLMNGNGPDADAIGKETTAQYNDGNWHHIGFTSSYVPGSGAATTAMFSLYVDGANVPDGSLQGLSLGGCASFSSTSTIMVANSGDATVQYYGALSDTRIYNRTLSSTEMLSIYNGVG